jgi:hypothetical protein
VLLLSEEGALLLWLAPLPRPFWEAGLLLWAALLPAKHVGADSSAYVSIRHTSASIHSTGYASNSPSAAQRALRERPERPQGRLRLRQIDRQRSLLTWQAQRAWQRA